MSVAGRRTLRGGSGNVSSSLHGSTGQQSGITEQALCVEPHEYGPSDPAAYAVWATARRAEHECHDCPDCGLGVIWRPHPPATPAQPEPSLFDLPEGGNTQ